MYSAQEVGNALRKIFNKINNNPYNQKTVNKECKGCYYCKYYSKQEMYDQQWGTFYFTRGKCKKNNNKEKDIDISLGIKECKDFKYGKNEIVYINEKEKEQIKNYLYKRY